MRHIVAVMVVVAGALGADRLAVAAPIRAPQLSQTVRQLADRFSCGFQTVLPDIRPQHMQEQARQPARQLPPAAPAVVSVHTVQSTPFQFRLPPPME